MTATYEQARDDMFSALKAAWDTTGYPIAWPDTPEDGIPPDEQTPWARVALRHSSGRQRGLGGSSRRYERGGVLLVQVFAPRSTATSTTVGGLSRAYQLAKIVADALEGQSTSRGVWFRNTRVNEAEPSGNFSQLNVIAEFTYDEIK